MTDGKMIQILKDSSITVRVNSLVKKEFKDLLNERGLSITDFVKNAIVNELKKEGRSVHLKIEEKII
jgi:antitoxin component of RelBE/YafQ-DinJ toxin-antitoxin module